MAPAKSAGVIRITPCTIAGVIRFTRRRFEQEGKRTYRSWRTGHCIDTGGPINVQISGPTEKTLGYPVIFFSFQSDLPSLSWKMGKSKDSRFGCADLNYPRRNGLLIHVTRHGVNRIRAI